MKETAFSDPEGIMPQAETLTSGRVVKENPFNSGLSVGSTVGMV